MNVCANHNQTQATSYCRTCGKPLCDECKRDVRGVIYCEECIAARLAGTLPTSAAAAAATVAPPPGLPNPTLAAFLGVIPGVGAFYNGQYIKGLVHILMLPMIIALANMEEMFALLFIAYFPYMIVDAYQTAKAKVLGTKAPDMLGLNSMFGESTDATSVAATTTTADGRVVPAAANRPPIGAILLIGLGTLFLISNMGVLPPRFLRGWWAMALIGVGVYQAIKVMSVRDQANDDSY